MNVIPLPNKFHFKDSFFVVNANTTINYSHELKSSAEVFVKYVESESSVILNKSDHANINFILDFTLQDEEYKIDITENNLTLTSRANPGAFYGVMTLQQLFQKQPMSMQIQCAKIEDEPRFKYRGFMLDVARHFFNKQEIFRIIDLISFLKFNTLHLHLTDDQGWRIESEKYPLLNVIGSTRVGTTLKNKKLDNIIHQGYYTKSDLKEIVKYAKEKCIEVIPEIDMPGHMEALIASYPNTSCENKQITVKSGFGISKNILCAGNDEVYKMIEELLLELIEIFDSKYIHIGGDEALKHNWKKCAKCQQKIKDNVLKNETELQTFFFNYFHNFLRSHKKISIGWNDVCNEKLNLSTIIQHWKPFSNSKTIKEVNLGRQVIISNFFYLYLDYPYSLTPLKKTYNFEPILRGIKLKDNVIGIEAPLWTEWVNNTRKIDFQVFPRIASVSEVAWTEEKNKSFDDFLFRLKHFNLILDQYHVFYARNVEKPLGLFKRILKTYRWIKNENIEFDDN